MKKCIISLSLLFYITFLNEWNGVESNPTTPNGTESSSTATNPTPVTTTKTAVTLDISKSSGTDQYDYTDKDGLVTYKSKDNNVFDKVSDGTKDIWESKNDVYGILVRIKTIKDVKSNHSVCRILVILMTNKLFKVFKEENSIFKDITATRPDVTKLKFLGDNDTELSPSDYEVSIVDLSFTYTFNTGVNCQKIKYDDDEVWKPGDDTKFNTIKKLRLGLASNKFYVINSSDESKQLTKPKITIFSLNIEKTESTDEYDYTDQNGLFTYKPKSGCLFSKVSHGTTDIWESKDYVYATLVMSKTVDSKKYLAILLTDNSFKVFHEDAGNWNDITTDRYDVTNLKFLGENDAVITTSDYTVTLVDLSFTYKFNDGVKCKNITYSNDPMWNHADDPKFAEIKSFSLGLASNTFSVMNQSDHTKELNFKPTSTPESQPTTPPSGTPTTPSSGTCTPASPSGGTTPTPTGGTTSPKAGSTTPAKTQPPKASGTDTVTAVTLDIFKTESTSEFNYLKDGNFRTYTPKPNHVFNKVVKKSLEIWTAKPNDHSLKAVLMGSGRNEKYLGILLKSLNFVLLHKSGKNKPWNDITSKRHDVTKLKFLGESDTELKSTDYTVTIVDLSFAYIFNTGVKCRKVTYCDDEVWNHTDDTNFSEIKSLSLGLASNKFFVKNQSDIVKNIEKVFESTETQQSTQEPEETQDSTQQDPTQTQDSTQESTEETQQSQQEPTPTEEPTQQEPSQTEDSKQESTEETQQSQQEPTPTQDSKQEQSEETQDSKQESTEETQQSQQEPTPTQDSTQQSTPPATKPETEDSKQEPTKQEESTPTEEPEQSTKPETEESTPTEKYQDKSVTKPDITLDSIDTNTSHTTTDFDYSKSSDFHKYTPKPGYVFKKVSKSNTDIWESKDDVYGTQLMYIEGVKYLVLLLTDNTFKLFELVGNEWKDVTSKRHDVTKVKFFGDNDAEIKSSDYNASLVDFFYRLKFNTDVKCKRITYNDDDVWKHSDDPKFKEITLFSLGLASNKFFVKNQSGHFKKLNFKPHPGSESTPASDLATTNLSFNGNTQSVTQS